MERKFNDVHFLFREKTVKVVLSYQFKLIIMRAEIANLNHCAVPFLSRAAVNFRWYCCTYRPDIHTNMKKTFKF